VWLLACRCNNVRLATCGYCSYNNGRYPPGRGPKAGLAVARELGLLTYQSFGYFNGRFDWGYEPKSYVHVPVPGIVFGALTTHAGTGMAHQEVTSKAT